VTTQDSPLSTQADRAVHQFLLHLFDATHDDRLDYRNHPYTDAVTLHVIAVRRDAEAALKRKEYVLALALAELAEEAIREYEELLP
jgi:hypothetical protein